MGIRKFAWSGIKSFAVAGLLLIASSGVRGQKIPPEKPKLIVGITVSGMSNEYLNVYWDKFGEGGFRRLAGMGANCKNAQYDFLITDPSAGLASLATGTRPSEHGVVSDYWFQRVTNEIVGSIADPEQRTVGGNYDAGLYSPASLNARTLADELRLKSRLQSRSIGISMDPKTAVFMSGHTSTGAYWLDPVHGKWITSSYYMDSLPDWVRKFNDRMYQDTYLQRIWQPLLPIAQYSESLLDNNPYETGLNDQITFPYNLEKLSRQGNQRDYKLLMSTPFGNTYTKDLAVAAIVHEKLGMWGVTDMIHIGFNATRYLAEKYSTWSVETQDMYLRLDQDIAHLLEFLDEHLGMENVLVYLTAENAMAVDPRYLADSGIPSGYFNYRTSISLLRSYLNAIYGRGDWVTLYYAQQIFLNHELIEDSDLRLEEVQDRVARFMVDMNGVSKAVQAYVLQQNHFSSGILQKIQNSYYQKHSGDVILFLKPGWVEHSSLGSTNGFTEFKYEPHVPLMFYGWKIKRTTLSEKLSPTDVASTLASYLDISMSQLTTGKVIQGLK